MTWANDISKALRRANSPYSFEDWMGWLRSGQVEMAVAPCLHGSIWFNPDDTPEVAHISGKWCPECVQWLQERMMDAADARGVDFIEINGRRGWARFLSKEGVKTHGRDG